MKYLSNQQIEKYIFTICKFILLAFFYLFHKFIILINYLKFYNRILNIQDYYIQQIAIQAANLNWVHLEIKV